jgi:hypothetical protein
VARQFSTGTKFGNKKGKVQKPARIPPLTTIRQPLKEIAKTAIGIFMDDDSEERHATLLGELVIRESCGCQWDKTSEREP